MVKEMSLAIAVILVCGELLYVRVRDHLAREDERAYVPEDMLRLVCYGATAFEVFLLIFIIKFCQIWIA